MPRESLAKAIVVGVSAESKCHGTPLTMYLDTGPCWLLCRVGCERSRLHMAVSAMVSSFRFDGMQTNVSTSTATGASGSGRVFMRSQEREAEAALVLPADWHSYAI